MELKSADNALINLAKLISFKNKLSRELSEYMYKARAYENGIYIPKDKRKEYPPTPYEKSCMNRIKELEFAILLEINRDKYAEM